MNPIFEYAAKGQQHENRKRWESALFWYQRALACLPNLVGCDNRIPPIPLRTGDRTLSFKPSHASRIYSALGRVLKALGRMQESVLAHQAADALDSESRLKDTVQPPKQGWPEFGTSDDPEVRREAESAPSARAKELKGLLTLVMATHCTRRLTKFEALSPPSSKLVTATYGSMLRVFGEGIDQCPKIMCYDTNPAGSARDRHYARSIETFSKEHGFNLRTYHGVGLFNVLNRTIQMVDTPYLLFVEHDWLFRGGPIELPLIMEMMNASPRINAIRFNKRANHINGQDFIVCPDTAQSAYPLLQTSSISNNPGIFRTDTLMNRWLPLCEKALARVLNDLGGSAFGIEEILFKAYVKDIRSKGFEKAHEKWGPYIFGRAGDPARVTHLGE